MQSLPSTSDSVPISNTNPLATALYTTAPTTYVATIAAAANISSGVSLGSNKLYAVGLPSVWVNAVVTFRGSVDGTNYFDLVHENGKPVALEGNASTIVLLDTPVQFKGLTSIVARSGTSASPVTQTSQSNVLLITLSS